MAEALPAWALIPTTAKTDEWHLSKEDLEEPADFKTGVDKGIDKADTENKQRTLNAPQDSFEKKNEEYLTKKAEALPSETLPEWAKEPSKASKESLPDWAKDTKTPVAKPVKLNWAGTGPELTTKEYFKAGFAGRFISGAVASDSDLMAKADKSVSDMDKKDPKKYHDAWNREYHKLKDEEKSNQTVYDKSHPETTTIESLKAVGSQLVNHPSQFGAGLIYGFGQDPEMMFGLGVLGIGSKASMAARIASKLGTIEKVSVASKVATGTSKGILLGVSSEGAAEIGDRKGFDPQKLLNVGIQFGVMGGALEGVGGVYKNARTSKQQPKVIDAKFEDSRIKKDETIAEGLKRARDKKDQEFLDKSPKQLIDDSHSLALEDANKAKYAAKREYLDNAIGFIGVLSPKERLVREKELLKTPNNLAEMIYKMDEAYFEMFDKSAPKHLEALKGRQEAMIKRKTNEALSNERLGVTNNTIHSLLPTDGSMAAFRIAEEHISKTELDPAKATVEALKAIQNDPSLTPTQQATIKAQLPILEENLTNPPIKQVNNMLLTNSTHNAVLITKNGLFANERLSENRSKEIVTKVPEEVIRKKITMSMDSDKDSQQLKTDAEKALKLVELTKSVKKYEEDINAANTSPKTERRFDQRTNEIITARLKRKWDNLQLIKHTLAQKLENAKLVLEKVRNEPSEEHAIPVQKALKQRLDDLHAIAKSFGLLETKIKNYVPHILNWSGFKGTEAQKLSLMERINKVPEDPRIKQDSTIQRQYASIQDLDKVLEGTGVLVERDIAKIMETYEKNIYAAAAHKQLIDWGKANRGSDGNFLIKPNLAKVHGDGYVAFDGVGSKALEGMLVHPEFKTILGHVFRQSNPGKVARAISAIGSTIKSNNVFGSLFHFTTLGVAHITEKPSSILHPIATVKAMNRAIEIFKNGVGEDQTNLLLKDGGLIVGTDDSHETMLMQQAATVDKYLSMLSSVHDTKFSQTAVKYPEMLVQYMNKMTWEFAHAGSKLHLANTILTDMIARNPDKDPKALAKEVSAHINTVFGGLNWTEIAASTHAKMLEANNPVRKGALKAMSYVADKAGSIQGRERMQWVMFAPDWTVSAFRSVSDALPHSLDIKEGVKGIINPTTRSDLARRYVINASIAYVTILNGINMAFNNGQSIWDNEDPTKISLGDGRSIQVAKHMMEFIEWMRHPEDTLGNKLAFFPKAATIALTGKTNILNEKSKIKDDSAVNRALEIAKSALPFAVGAYNRAPTGEKITESVSSFVGMPISGPKKSRFEDKSVLKEKAIKRGTKKAESLKKKKKELDRKLAK